MNSPEAALIGAGVGSAVTFAGLFIGNELAVRRERRGQRRERLHNVVTEAALALYSRTRSEPLTQEELDALDPDSVAGHHPELLLLGSHMEATNEAVTLLKIHFGYDHPLIDSYMNAVRDSLSAHSRWLRDEKLSEAQRIKNVPETATIMADAQRARARWTDEARTVVDEM